MGGNIVGLLIYFILGILFLLVCREIVCWYWKINKAVEILENMDTNIAQMCQAMESLNQNMIYMAKEAENHNYKDNEKYPKR